MSGINRRQALKAGSAAALAWNWGPLRSQGFEASPVNVSTFRVNVSPPLGHSLCGGWITPAERIEDDLEAIGIVLTGNFDPVVLCAVDWTGIHNATHLLWRTKIAEAVGTDPRRVAVQCVHQHNAPFACLDAQAIVRQHEELPDIADPVYVRKCADDVAKAAKESLTSALPVTHVATGKAKVDRVASNRRTIGENGLVEHWRGSSSRNPIHQELPEGLIDPWLRSVVLMNGERRVCALHYYATHPMSFYGDGIVNSDFVGLARKRKQERDPECCHLYFTGCSGNIAAGKYNDGSMQARIDLTDRVYAAIEAAEEDLSATPIRGIRWRTRDLTPPVRSTLDEEALLAQIADSTRRTVDRNRPAYQVAWLRRSKARQPIILSSLELGPATLLHLPAESFIEYQLAAQEMAGERFVATAAYGDGGPWYIPTEDAYPQGGYEVAVAFCDPGVDPQLRAGIEPLVTD